MNILSSFTWVDGIIVAAVVLIIASVIFLGFIRKGKKSGCKGCPYAKNCTSDTGSCADMKKTAQNQTPPSSDRQDK